MATSLEISKKRSRSIIYTQKAFIRRKDPEIICLREIIKKDLKKIMEGKIYSPSGKFAEQAKQVSRH